MPSSTPPKEIQEAALDVANWIFYKVPTKDIRLAARNKLLEFYERGYRDGYKIGNEKGYEEGYIDG